VKQPNLSPQQWDILAELKATDGGLDKYQMAGRVNVSVYMVDIHLGLLAKHKLIEQRGNRHYILDAGLIVLQQPELPGMGNVQ
jgi:predicted transcriptional regulator